MTRLMSHDETPPRAGVTITAGIACLLIMPLAETACLGAGSSLNISTTRTQDEMIGEQVRTALTRDPGVRSYLIHVWVKNGTVILSGRVDSPYERERASEIVSTVTGVSSVMNRLIDPTRWTWDHDWQVRDRIEGVLSRHPRLSEHVAVTIRDGVTTLLGTVPTDKDRHLVEKLALENGALLVNNRIRVEMLSGQAHHDAY